MTTAAPSNPPAVPVAEPRPVAPSEERFVTYRALLGLCGAVLIALTAMGGGLTVWILGTARQEAQLPLARVAALETANKSAADLAQTRFVELAGQVGALRAEIRQDGAATRGKIDDLMLLLATGKVKTAGQPKSHPEQVPTSLREAP